MDTAENMLRAPSAEAPDHLTLVHVLLEGIVALCGQRIEAQTGSRDRVSDLGGIGRRADGLLARFDALAASRRATA